MKEILHQVAGEPVKPGHSLKEVAWLFLKLGVFAFGGPAAHIAMMEDEVVRRRKWLSHEEFLDLLGATNLIPGPNSTEMAIHIGRRRAGWRGLVVAGACFILPATLMVWALAWCYMRFGFLPEVQGILYGIKPVIIAIVVQALWRLARGALKKRFLIFLGAAAMCSNAMGANELLVLLAAGLFAMMGMQVQNLWKSNRLNSFMGPASLFLAGSLSPFLRFAPSSKLVELFLIFIKIGSVLFGSGYVLLVFLQADFVDYRHWLTQTQLLDAAAVGQFTPGPVFTTATFIGYVIAGHFGALVATLGIFLPAFVLVAVSSPLLPHLRKSLAAGAFLDGVNVASLALMAVVSCQLGRAALIDPMTIFIALLSFIVLFLFRLNSAWLVVGGELLGVLKVYLVMN